MCADATQEFTNMQASAKKMRERVALALGRIIMDLPGTSEKEKIKSFFKIEMRSYVKDRKHNNYYVHDYHERSAISAVQNILWSKSAWLRNYENHGRRKFSVALMEYINNLDEIVSTGGIPDSFLDCNFDSGLSTFANGMQISRGHYQDFLVSQLLDRCSRIPKNNSKIDCSATNGIFLIASVVIEHDHDSSSGRIKYNVVFADTFNHIDKEEIILKDKHKDDIIEIHRIASNEKPTMTAADLSLLRKIYRNLVPIGEKSDPGLIMSKLISLVIHLVRDRFIPMDQDLDKQIGCGHLKRMILDVEDGAVFAAQVDQGQQWALAFCPIEDRIWNAFETFTDIISEYERVIKSNRVGRKF